MSDSMKIFITDDIEYITDAEICQIHKTFCLPAVFNCVRIKPVVCKF